MDDNKGCVLIVVIVAIFLLLISGGEKEKEVTQQKLIEGCYEIGGVPVMNNLGKFQECKKESVPQGANPQ